MLPHPSRDDSYAMLSLSYFLKLGSSLSSFGNLFRIDLPQKVKNVDQEQPFFLTLLLSYFSTDF